MTTTHEIRANYDATTIVVYQAFREAIALPALQAQRFVSPFSLTHMTWIKPSFLWMMERSGWAQKPGQEYILAVRITRAGWEEALSHGVLTHPEKSIYGSAEAWKEQMKYALVNIQWDPERSIRGAHLPYDSIQVGLSRHISPRYVDEWTVSIEDVTPLVKKMHAHLRAGDIDKAKKHLPVEKVYPIPDEIGRRIMTAPK
jgi:hypothetical protein